MTKRRPKGTGWTRNRGTKNAPRWHGYYWAADATGRHQVSVPGGPWRTKEECEEQLANELGRKREGRPTSRNKITVAEMLGKWLGAKRLSGNTRAEYRRCIDQRIVPRIGHHRVRDLSSDDVDDMLDELRAPGGNLKRPDRGLSESSVQYTRGVLYGALEWAVRRSYCPANVVDDTEAVDRDTPEMQVWDGDQLSRFMTATAAERDHPLWRLAAYSGLRRSELLGLQWRDVDLKARTVQVRRVRVRVRGEGVVTKDRTKTKAGTRTVKVDAETAAVLKRWRKAQKEERLAWGEAYYVSQWVLTRPDGRPWEPSTVGSCFQRAIRRAAKSEQALPVLHFHELRHTHASLLLMAGRPPIKVAARLGHKLATLLSVYAHFIPDDGDDGEDFARIVAAGGS